MNQNNNKIKELKSLLVCKFNINTDRDLLKQLNITNDIDKQKLFLWIRYQQAFSYREGYDNACTDIIDMIVDNK